MNHRTAAAFLFTLAIASVAGAQSNPAAKPTDSGIMDTSLQVTGSVISSEANRLVVKTDNGQEMVFIITDKQVDASLFHTGDRVTASYTTLAGTGAVVTKVIAAPAAQVTNVTTYTPPATPTKPTPAAEPYVAPAPAPVTRTPVAPITPAPSDSTYVAPAESALPATAGPLPLVGLIGLLGAGGAATIRRFRRS